LRCCSAGSRVEDRRPTLLVQLGDEIGGVVRRHLSEDRRGLLVRPVPEELPLVMGVQLLEHVRLELGVLLHRGEDLLALVV
jgi:hypothetical protein